MKLPAGITVHTWINALSIPLIAGILLWVLHRVLDADAWCSAQAELTKQTTTAELLRCGQILLKQLEIGFYVAVGLVAALALSHIVSVVRDVKAHFALDTKLGSVSVGGEARGAQKVAEAADRKAEEIIEGREGSERPN